MKKLLEKYDNYFFRKTRASNLAFARIIVSLFCIIYLSHDTHVDYPNSEFYSNWTPNSIFHFFPNDLSKEFLFKIRMVFKISLILMFFGLSNYLWSIVAFISGFIIHGYYTNFSNEVYHHSQMAIFALGILSLGPASDSISLRNLILKKKFYDTTEKSQYRFPLVFLMIWVVVVYGTAGFQKLYYGEGLMWAFSQNLRLILLNTPRLTDFGEYLVTLPNFFIYTLGFFGLAVEALAPLALLRGKVFLIFIPFWISLHFFVTSTFGGHYAFFSQVGCYLALIPFILTDYDRKELKSKELEACGNSH